METIVGILFPVTFVTLLALERLFPARSLPPVRGWLAKNILFFIVGAFVGGVVPTLFAQSVTAIAPVHLQGLGTLLGGILGFLATDIVAYGVHRLLHNVPWLWRITHQLHHSAERVDVAGFAYAHPLDIALQAGTTAFAVGLLGLSADACALAGYFAFFLGVFQHMNVRTPQWLGYLIQRPEAHAVHHTRGVHAYNYGNFMLWDILLGTFRNPRTFPEPAGFWDGASSHVWSLLIGRDLAEPPSPRAPSSSQPPRSAAVTAP